MKTTTVLSIAALLVASIGVLASLDWCHVRKSHLEQERRNAERREDRLDHQVAIGNAIAAAVAAGDMPLDAGTTDMIPALVDADVFFSELRVRHPELHSLRACVAHYLLRKARAIADVESEMGGHPLMKGS